MSVINLKVKYNKKTK